MDIYKFLFGLARHRIQIARHNQSLQSSLQAKTRLPESHIFGLNTFPDQR
jgi:hypothetical protein